MVLIVPYMAGKAGSDPIYMVFAKVALILAIVYALATWIIPWIMLKVAQTRSTELFMFTVALICLGTAVLTEQAGLSMALGAFLAGLIIAGSQYAYQAISSVLPMRDLFTSFFFVSIGLRMDIGFLVDHPFVTIMLAIGVMIFNLLTTTLAMRLVGLSPRVAVMVGFSLCQIGEFSFVLAKIGADNKLLNDDAIKMFLNMAVLTMAMTPLSIALGRVISPKFANIDDTVPPQKAPEARDHAIVVGFGVAGQAVARACRYICKPYYVIDMNPSSVKNYRNMGEPLFFGDAASEHILTHVHIQHAKILVITIPDPEATRRIIAQAKALNPKLHILARTRFLLNIKLLKDLGADEVVAEEFEAALDVFDIVLRFFNVPEKERIEQTILAKTADPDLFRLLPGMDEPPPLDGVCNYSPGLHKGQESDSKDPEEASEGLDPNPK
jgi:CPA2 family monovalent cation:H+ antiporter-2